MNKALSGRLRELKNKRKVRLGNPKSGRGRGRGRLQERSFTRAFHLIGSLSHSSNRVSQRWS